MDARIEATGTAGARLETLSGRVALRHPGAPRLLQALGIEDPTDWLGEGSFALVVEASTQPTEQGRKVTLRAVQLIVASAMLLIGMALALGLV